MWLDSLGEWSWPGRAAEALPAPPSWVPALPPRLEPLGAGAGSGAAAIGSRSRLNVRALLLAGLLSAALAIAAGLALHDASFERLLGLRAAPAGGDEVVQSPSDTAPLPTLVPGPRDQAGSSIDTASFASAALGSSGMFHVYLPPGFASTSQRYPVLYLLHGDDQPASAFLQIGLQQQLDRLIGEHAIPPLIAVMIQGGRGANNWRNQYESYVLEVQHLVDRMLPTIPARSQRAIAGDSMGGYGAMNIALGHPQQFSVVESWLGFFNGLQGELRAATPTIEREGLHAFVYGGAEDHIADPAEDAPWAAQLRAAGASAHGVVYEGGHTLETLEANLERMLIYAGRSLGAGPPVRAALSRAR